MTSASKCAILRQEITYCLGNSNIKHLQNMVPIPFIVFIGENKLEAKEFGH